MSSIEINITRGRKSIYATPEERKEAKRRQVHESYLRNKEKYQVLKNSMTVTQKQLISILNHEIFPDPVLNAIISTLSKHGS
jgi:ribosomal protein S4